MGQMKAKYWIWYPDNMRGMEKIASHLVSPLYSSDISETIFHVCETLSGNISKRNFLNELVREKGRDAAKRKWNATSNWKSGE